MTGLTVAKGIGLMAAALAVSGTALFLAYGYKKKTRLNIRNRKYVHNLSEPLKKDSGIVVEMSKGKMENGNGGAHLPQMPRRPTRPLRSSIRTHEPTREEELSKDKLVQCPDAELISCLHEEARSSFRAVDQLVVQLKSGSDSSSLKSTDLSDSLDNPNKGAEKIFGESTPVSGARIEDFETKADFDGPPASSSPSFQQEQTSETISVASPPPKFALVGCLCSSGNGANGNGAGRRKKQVRFSPSVMEPSSNNHDYRRRVGQQRGGAQTVVQEQPSETVRATTANARPRVYSQAAKHTMTYNVGRCDYRYSSRAYYPGHL